MGSNLIIVVFAVVVIGGMGSILGSILTGLVLGIDRGPDQGVLPRGLEHRRVRDHGHRADDPAGRPVREGEVMSAPTTPRAASPGWRRAGHADRRALHRPVPDLHDEGAVLRDLRLRLQPAARLHRAAVVRPRRLPGRGGLRHRLAGAQRRLVARARRAGRHADRRGARPGGRADRDPPPGHLLRDDHAGDGADGLLRLPAGALHRRRGRPAGRAARQAVRPDRPGQRPGAVLRRAGGLRRRVPVHRAHRALALRPGAQGDPRERAARRLAGLRRRPLQAAGLRAVDRAGRAWPAR